MGIREITVYTTNGWLPSFAPLVLLVKKQHIDEEECTVSVEWY